MVWAPRLLACKALEGRVCLPPAAYSVEAAHVPCTRYTSSLCAIREMLTGNPAGQEHHITAEGSPTLPTTPPLATMTASPCHPPTHGSSAAPSEASASPPDSGLCRLPLTRGRAQAEPRMVDQPSKGHLPQTRGLCPKLGVSALRPTVHDGSSSTFQTWAGLSL